MPSPKSKLTRAERNHNPGNLRRAAGTKWQGTDCPQTDTDFVVFESPKWGFRALATVLKQYQKRHQLDTVEKIIGRFAPPIENETGAYVEHVCDQLDVMPDEPINVLDWSTMLQLCKAIATAESGRCSWSDEVITSGLVAAGLQMPAPASPAPLQPTSVAAIGGTIAAASTIVLQSLDVLKGATDHARTLGGDALGPALALVTLLAIITLSVVAARRGRILGA